MSKGSSRQAIPKCSCGPTIAEDPCCALHHPQAHELQTRLDEARAKLKEVERASWEEAQLRADRIAQLEAKLAKFTDTPCAGCSTYMIHGVCEHSHARAINRITQLEAELVEVEREYDVERKRLYRQAVDADARSAQLEAKVEREPRQQIPGCQHTRQRMNEWIDARACPICLTASLGMANNRIAQLESKLAEVESGGSVQYAALNSANARIAQLEAKLGHAVEAMKPRLRKGHYDTCSYALTGEHDCDCGYAETYRLLAELGMLADLAKPEGT